MAAPDFTLKDQNGQDFSLAQFRGLKNVVLVFYPFAFSGICTGELCEIRDDLGGFVGDDVQVLAASCDHMFSQRAWADKEGFDKTAKKLAGMFQENFKKYADQASAAVLAAGPKL